MTYYDKGVLKLFDKLFDEYNAGKKTKEQMLKEAAGLHKRLSLQYVKTGV